MARTYLYTSITSHSYKSTLNYVQLFFKLIDNKHMQEYRVCNVEGRDVQSQLVSVVSY